MSTVEDHRCHVHRRRRVFNAEKLHLDRSNKPRSSIFVFRMPSVWSRNRMHKSFKVSQRGFTAAAMLTSNQGLLCVTEIETQGKVMLSKPVARL
ncbi:uncharacterized protein G2W53_014888 [Senna tora]|uniref:Uncharacterized protein n=1 Tax=Senna tora TaxID=362788 RepID=A0A834WUF4_9FABA|nr:uncharacterized protein G2W53_014888 [Senna tora]